MTIRTFVIFLAGIVAGAMNAAGGGGSFLSVPALIWIGIPSVSANMSSTIALYPGSLTSAWAYRGNFQDIGTVSRTVLCLTTLAGGLAGAILLLRTPNSSFDKILPALLLLGSFAFALGPKIGGTLAGYRFHPASLVTAQFFLGCYGGYFGGAVGIMMMAVWSLFGVHDVKAMNPIKVVLVAAANTVAVICFVAVGSVAWHETVVMLIAAAIGGYLGARLALAVASSKLRVGISVMNFIVTAAFFWFRYGHK